MANKKQRIKILDLPQEMEISRQEIRNIVGGAHIGPSLMSTAFPSTRFIRIGIESWRSPDLVSRIMNPNKLAIK
jgi:hypothetical protein